MCWKLLPIFILFYAQLSAQSWQQLGDFPGTARDDGAMFIIGTNVYCGTGLNASFAACSDFYILDTQSDTWNAAAFLPSSQERQYALGFTTGANGYIFGGIGAAFLNDLWQYDPIVNGWISATPMPSAGRAGMCGFVIGSDSYVIGGKNSSTDALNEVWCYNPANGWQQKNNFPYGGRWRASATANNGKGYMIFGRDENESFHAELYEYDPLPDTWIPISVFPGAGRNYAAVDALAEYLVVMAGIDTMNIAYNDLWTYHIPTGAWEQHDPLPSVARKGGMGFVVSGSMYYTTGISQANIRLAETWKANDIVGLNEEGNISVSIYPNPVSNTLNIKTTLSKPLEVSLYAIEGNLVTSKILENGNGELIMQNESPGIYVLKLSSRQSSFYRKIIKGF